MKRREQQTIIIPILMFAALACAADWVKLSSMKEARAEHASAVFDGKIYVLTGLDSDHSRKFHPEVYNPATDTWTVLKSKYWNLNHVTAGSSVYGDEILICAGQWANKAKNDTLYAYNPAKDSWRFINKLPTTAWGGPLVVCNDELHYIGGFSAKSQPAEKRHFVLNLKNIAAGWKSEPLLPKGYGHSAGVAIGDRIYIVGGESQHAPHQGMTNILQIYDTKTDTWSSGEKMPKVRSHHDWATFVHRGEIWCASGITMSGGNPVGQSEIFIYNPGNNKWRAFAKKLPFPMCSPGVRIVDGKLYLFGGGKKTSWFTKDAETWMLNLDEPTYAAYGSMRPLRQTRADAGAKVYSAEGKLVRQISSAMTIWQVQKILPAGSYFLQLGNDRVVRLTGSL